MNENNVNNTNIHFSNSFDFTIRVLRVTFFWDRVQVVRAVLQVGCPLQEDIGITPSMWLTSSWTVFLLKTHSAQQYGVLSRVVGHAEHREL